MSSENPRESFAAPQPSSGMWQAALEINACRQKFLAEIVSPGD